MSEFTASNGVQVRPGRVAGLHVTCNGDGKAHDLSDGETDALREFFQQEGSSERKPWEDAKPGDVWVFTYFGEVEVVAVANLEWPFVTAFRSVTGKEFNTKNVHITSARRIWPEDGS